MNWPPASDYQDAIQNPQTCFQDLGLKAGQPALTRLGLPRVASGNFASVYELGNGSQRWAVRCFLRQAGNQQERYTHLTQYLAKLSLPGLVGFAYLPQGILVRGQWYPIVKMEWVEGANLHTYVAGHLRDKPTLKNLALQWRGLMDRLRQNKIAHADLQHGNVLVTPQGQLCLVDYDGMFVPALRGQLSQELGHPNYQHPRRAASDYDEKLDNFSALVIYTSLVALMVEPDLWDQFHTGENLLFSAADFKSPQTSDLFQKLRQCQDSTVCGLTERLERACTGMVAQSPDFRAVVNAFSAIPEAKLWWQEAIEQSPTKRPSQPRKAAPASKSKPRASAPAAPPVNTSPPWWKKLSVSHDWLTQVKTVSYPRLFTLGTVNALSQPTQATIPLKAKPAPPPSPPAPRSTPLAVLAKYIVGTCLLGIVMLCGLAMVTVMLFQKFKAELFPPAHTKTVTRPVTQPASDTNSSNPPSSR